MTNEQRALLSADRRRHLALAKYSNEAYIREMHEAIAEALGAAIDEGEVSSCGSEIRPREAPKTPLSVVGTVIHINRAHRHCTLEYQVFGTTMRESFKI